MKESNWLEYASWANTILLGLVMLVPGLMKLFVVKPSTVVGMVTGLGFPAPSLFAWVLILSEIICGVAILARWNLKYTTIPPALIMIIAAVLVYKSQIPSLLVHLSMATNYLYIGQRH